MLWREGNDAMRNKLKDHINDVRLRGIVAGEPRVVGLAQGEVVEFRLQVARIEGGSDQLDLVSRLPRLRRSAATLKEGKGTVWVQVRTLPNSPKGSTWAEQAERYAGATGSFVTSPACTFKPLASAASAAVAFRQPKFARATA